LLVLVRSSLLVVMLDNITKCRPFLAVYRSHPCSKTSCYYSFILKTSSKGEEMSSVEPGSRFKGRWPDDETRGRMMTCAQRAQRMTPVVRVENDRESCMRGATANTTFYTVRTCKMSFTDALL